MNCSMCGSNKISFQRENTSSTTKTNYYSKHGILYYVLVWWWLWFIKLIWWFIKVIFTCGLSIFFKKKNKIGNSVGKTKNNFKTIAVCQNCGNSWYV